MPVSAKSLEAAYQRARSALLAERTAEGHWVGELSPSALSTATAIMALAQVQRALGDSRFASLIDGGLRWLMTNQNTDGGWGDTTRSFSNISTTMLCRAALHLTGAVARGDAATLESLRRAEAWLGERYGKTPSELAESVRQRYGVDRTFAVPILTTCAIAGLVEWREVPPLPFEMACFPQSWYRFLRLHVVSYALPALIAIGQAIHHFRPTWNPITRVLRWATKGSSLNVLRAIQPSSGGYLEATPLTSFVALSLASIGHAEHPVATHAVEFLRKSVLGDGSWAIDSNLATWVTTLSVNALAAAGDLESFDRTEPIRDWLVGQQFRERHPFTGADPGGWGWTDLPGSVPDADDSPGALLALRHLTAWSPGQPRPAFVQQGIRWLLGLQNRDGGWPTFCRGWGHLPFDRSGTDLTAHVLRALHAWDAVLPTASAMVRGFEHLGQEQRLDGSWLPLWFGNQHAADDENPTYGTAKVLAAYRDLGRWTDKPAVRGLHWLLANQNPDGGWGGGGGAPSSMEETSLAMEIVADAGPEADQARNAGADWLIDRLQHDDWSLPTPIGFYFAKLWYYEKMYPLVGAVAALGRLRKRWRSENDTI
ncbi:MAG: squalene--hopene cyclase [Gemmataceae bacterium]|nr:squalene--hopene cyclase [Gemmataceae bacterium]